MAVTFNYLDKDILSKPLDKMNKLEKQLLDIRLHEIADSIKSSGINDELLALRILESNGTLPEGTVQRMLDSVKDYTPEATGRKSVYATRLKGNS